MAGIVFSGAGTDFLFGFLRVWIVVLRRNECKHNRWILQMQVGLRNFSKKDRIFHNAGFGKYSCGACDDAVLSTVKFLASFCF